jgi:hypothetical protein
MSDRRAEAIIQSHRAQSNADWLIEQTARETNRLRAILRDSQATAEEKHIARDQLNYWQSSELAANVSNSQYGFQIRRK